MLLIEFDTLQQSSSSSPIIAKSIQFYAQVVVNSSTKILKIYDRYEHDEVSRIPLKQLLDIMNVFILNNNKSEDTDNDNIVTVRLPRLSRSLDQELQFPSKLIDRVKRQQEEQQQQQQQEVREIVILFEFL